LDARQFGDIDIIESVRRKRRTPGGATKGFVWRVIT
jgi:hypothetical protein